MRRSPEQIAEDRTRLLHEVPTKWTPTAAIGTGSHVSADLRWLEGQGLVGSRLRSKRGEKRLFYCIRCEQVLTTDNWDQCDDGGKHDVRPFYPRIRFKEWCLTAAGVDALEFPRLKAA